MVISRLLVLHSSGWVCNQTLLAFISYKSGSWEVQKQGARKCRVRWGFAVFQKALFSFFSQNRKETGACLSMSAYKGTNTSWAFYNQDLITSQRPHSKNQSHWGLELQDENLEETSTVNGTITYRKSCHAPSTEVTTLFHLILTTAT